MKKLYNYVWMGLVALLVVACAKDSLWNQDGTIPETAKGTILGQLINDDDNLPLKGVKILFERQTTAKGGQTFVDTVSTDTEGRFSYQIPFPNKVKVSIRDTGRYALDETFVEVLEHKDYPITMNSHPRFGVMPIQVHVNDRDFDLPMEGVNVSLWVRETSNEAYSLVETILTDEEGNVQFENVAWPVHYEVRIDEEADRYVMDTKSGKITTKDPVELTLDTERLFGVAAPLTIQTVEFGNSSQKVGNVALVIKYKLDGEDEFTEIDGISTDSEGVLETTVPYPSDIIISIEDNGEFFPAEIEGRIVKGGGSAILEVDDIPVVANVNMFVSNPLFSDGIAGRKITVYQRNLNSSDTYVLLGDFETNLAGIADVEVSYPKELKIVYSNGQPFGAHETPSEIVVEVPDYNTVNINLDYPETGLIYFSRSSVVAQLPAENADIYNLGGNNSGEYTIQLKHKLVNSGGLNPSFFAKYNGSTGNSGDGWAFMHSGHNGSTSGFQWRFKLRGAQAYSGANGLLTPGSDEWVTLTAVIFQNGANRQITVYTNGVRGQTVQATASGSSTSNMNIGFNSSYQTSYADEYIKDVRFYNVALPEAYIQSTYCQTFMTDAQDAYYNNLIGYWPMNDGSGGKFKNLIYPDGSKDFQLSNSSPNWEKFIEEYCD